MQNAFGGGMSLKKNKKLPYGPFQVRPLTHLEEDIYGELSADHQKEKWLDEWGWRNPVGLKAELGVGQSKSSTLVAKWHWPHGHIAHDQRERSSSWHFWGSRGSRWLGRTWNVCQGSLTETGRSANYIFKRQQHGGDRLPLKLLPCAIGWCDRPERLPDTLRGSIRRWNPGR